MGAISQGCDAHNQFKAMRVGSLVFRVSRLAIHVLSLARGINASFTSDGVLF